MWYGLSEFLLICVYFTQLNRGGSDHDSIEYLPTHGSYTCIFMLLLLFLADIHSVLFLCSGLPGLLHNCQYLRFEELRCSCPYRLNYKIILQIWPWDVDGGTDGHIHKPISQISSGLVQVVKHNALHPAHCHLKHWSVKQLTCHTFCFYLPEPWTKQTHIRSVWVYWDQINPKLMFA